MSIIRMIVAKGLNNEIGTNGDLAFPKLTGELAVFSRITKGKNYKKGLIISAIIMGRLTYLSLYKRKNGSRALFGRLNIVISNDKEFIKVNNDNIIIASSIEDALAKARGMQEIWFIGGSRIYSEAMKYCESIYLTQVYSTNEKADTFFPDITRKYKRVWASKKNNCSNHGQWRSESWKITNPKKKNKKARKIN